MPPALRITALLAFTRHTKPEFAWLLSLSDAALRKRLSKIRQRWRQSRLRILPGLGDPRGDLPFGHIRRTLISRVQDAHVVLASHDPDGHFFVVTSQIGRARQHSVSNI